MHCVMFAIVHTYIHVRLYLLYSTTGAAEWGAKKARVFLTSHRTSHAEVLNSGLGKPVDFAARGSRLSPPFPLPPSSPHS